MLVTGGAVLALTLVALAMGVAEPAGVGARHVRLQGTGASIARGAATSCAPSEQQPGCLRPWARASEAWAAAVGPSSPFQLHQQGFSPRGRAGFHPGPRAVHRAVRERLEALVTARERVMRAPTMPVSAGYASDRPTLVTRPLRGPPSHA
jgi:hypothetical protein